MKKPEEDNKEYTAFSDALGKVLRVSHSELKTRIEKEKKLKDKRKRRTD